MRKGVFSALALAFALASCSSGAHRSVLPAAGPAAKESVPAGTVRQHGFRARGAPGSRTPSSGPGTPLIYHNGATQHAPKIYVTFWGWTSDPQGEAPYLQGFLTAVGGSNWLNVVTQYYDTVHGTILNPATEFRGVWNDPRPSIPTDEAARSEVIDSVSHFGYDPDGLYFIAFPHGGAPSWFPTSTPQPGQYCSFHSTMYPNYGPVDFVEFPYMSDAGRACGANIVNTSGTLDGVSIVAGHELAEAQTDPQQSAWYGDGGSGDEIGDKCAWVGTYDYVFGSGIYPVQPLYSNAANGCTAPAPGWRQVPGSAHDIAFGADGSRWIIGNTANAGGYDIEYWNGGGWTAVDGGAVKIAVGPSGDPWVVNSIHQIFHRAGGASGSWQGLPGNANDIAVGRNGSVWIVTNTSAPGGYSPAYWNGSGWTVIAGGVTKIAVDPQGNPWAINSINQIFRLANGTWQGMPNQTATDISIGADGTVYILGTAPIPASYGPLRWDPSQSTWIRMDDNGASGGTLIEVDVNGAPWVINANNIYQRI
jgi:Tectonin domain